MVTFPAVHSHGGVLSFIRSFPSCCPFGCWLPVAFHAIRWEEEDVFILGHFQCLSPLYAFNFRGL